MDGVGVDGVGVDGVVGDGLRRVVERVARVDRMMLALERKRRLWGWPGMRAAISVRVFSMAMFERARRADRAERVPGWERERGEEEGKEEEEGEEEVVVVVVVDLAATAATLAMARLRAGRRWAGNI